MPCLLPPHALRNRGGRGLTGGGPGPVVWGSRVAGIMGKKEVEAWGFDSPPQFSEEGPCRSGRGGHGLREQGRLGASRRGAKGERGGRNPVRPLPWAGATRRSGAMGAAAACCSVCGSGAAG